MMIFDSVVIGAGPAGVTAALYLARFGLSVAMIEKMTIGGLVTQTVEVENYPGFPTPIKGYELADAFEAQLTPYAITRIRGEVEQFESPAQGPKRLLLDSGEWVEAKTVIIASGVQYKKLGLPNEDKLQGHGLSHCALCDGQFFKNKVIGVIGGGNSALEESLYLAKLASQLHIIHRRDEFRGIPHYIEQLKALPNVTQELSQTITELHGTEFLTGVTLRHVVTGATRHLDLDALFIFIGFTPTSQFTPDSIHKDEQKFIFTDKEMNTNVPGVFAAGDICSKLCRQIVTAVGDGATAANSANIYLEQKHA